MKLEINENGFVKTIDETPNKWIKLSHIIGVYTVGVQKSKNMDTPNFKIVVFTATSNHDVYSTTNDEDAKSVERELLKLVGKHV